MSLALPAVRRFGVVLRDQPWNTRAAEELIDLLDGLSSDQLYHAREIIDEILPRLSSENCVVTHAAVRLLADLVDNDIEEALAVIEKEAHKSWVQSVLELLSKKYFESERRNPFEHQFEVTNRLLDVALKVNPNDPIWMSRKLEVARFLGIGSKTQELVDQANQRFSRDPIIKSQTARLLTAHGTPESVNQARSLLHEAMAIEQDEGTGDVHPAIVDQLAYIAFLRDDLDEAERLYQDVLSVYPHDSRAHFGLGRVSFERGVAYWSRAFDEWLAAARAQLQSDEPEAPTILWRMVYSIASLCDAWYHKFSGGIRSTLLEQLKNMQRREDPAVASLIVEALQVLGVVDQPVVLAVLNGSSDTADRRLMRGVAQFLMASTIYGLLGPGANGADIRRAIDWCRERRVLAEYLAGAKGSYGRALMRLQLSGRDVGEILGQLQGLPTGTAWNRLFEHLATLGYKPNYYSDAYRLVDEINNPPTEQVEEFIRHLVWRVAHCIWANYSDTEAFLNTLNPSPSLCPLAQVLPLEEHKSRLSSIGGWVDVDTLESIEYELEREEGKRKYWHVQGAELVCELPPLWKEKNTSAYTRGGLYFRRVESSDATTQLSLCIDLSPGLERAA